MATTNSPNDEINYGQSLLGNLPVFDNAAENMLAASRTMLAAAGALSSALGPAGMREREFTAEAVELGVTRALRRDSLISGGDGGRVGESLLGLPMGKTIPGTGYGRMGASVTGSGARSQLYGAIGGAIGYAVGGPIGGILGGMLGGWLGGDNDEEAERARQQEEQRRQWLNSPQGFEIEAYLYNLYRGRGVRSLVPLGSPLFKNVSPQSNLPISGYRAQQIVVNFSPGAVQITGQGEEAGERAARAFAGSLGRVLRLNSVVVPAAGLGGDV